MGLKPGDSVAKAVFAPLMQHAPPGTFPPLPDDVDAQLARTTTTELMRKDRQLSQYYTALLALAKVPFADRKARSAAITLAGGNDILSRMVTLMTPFIPAFNSSSARELASLHATECLIALRRWQLRNRGLPPDMASLINGSALKTVPPDPYDGKPMRLALIGGEPVIYAVGSDGNDDGGQKDSDRDQRPTGDVLYRLAPRRGDSVAG